jgi:hypothetical protein
MSRYAIKFPFRVRIHGGEFDESARAIHREDGLKTIQAESGIVLGSTIERKQMSTKTTFKRIALVTVAALGFGVMSVAPSSAAIGQADSLSAASATSTATVGTAVTNIVTSSFVAAASGDTSTVTVSLQSSPATSGVLPTVTAAGGTLVGTGASSGVSGLTVTVTSGAAGRTTGFATVSLNPDVAGTYVVKITPHTGANAPALLWTVTASAVDNAANAGKTLSILNTGETTTASADATVVASMATATSAAATIVVTPKNAADAAIAATALTVTVAGPGTVATAADLTALAALNSGTGRAITGAAGSYTIGVFADGTAGVSTITISSGTTVLATETVTFYGAAAKITPTVVNSVLNIGNNVGAVTAVVTDAAGVAVPGVTVYAISGTDAVIDSDVYKASTAASTSAGAVSFDLNGLTAGTATITLSLNSSSAGTSTVSALAGTMRVSSGTPTKVDYKFDKETYAPGETAKITATVSDAVGVLGAGTYTVLTAAVTANYTLAALPGTLTVVAVGSTGTATYTVTIPTGISGALTLTGTAVSTVTATYGSATVVNAALDAANAAEDAANEAGDNANNAVDAANLALEAADRAELAAIEAGELAVAAAEEAGLIAQDALEAANEATDAALAAGEAAADATAAAVEAKDSADAATAAVAALATQVSALMAALNAKITTLSNLVAKIAKKVKA